MLQERVVEPLGGVKSRPVDVRILVATNKNLRQQVAAGLFREDLFFRLNVLEIESPPLRQRLDDLPQLVNHLLAGLAEKNKKNAQLSLNMNVPIKKAEKLITLYSSLMH